MQNKAVSCFPQADLELCPSVVQNKCLQTEKKCLTKKSFGAFTSTVHSAICRLNEAM